MFDKLVWEPTTWTKFDLMFKFPLDYAHLVSDNKEVVKVCVPGLKKEQIYVGIVNNKLLVRADLTKLTNEPGLKAAKTFSSSGPELTLPLSKLQLSSYPKVYLENGILTLTWEAQPIPTLENKNLSIP